MTEDKQSTKTDQGTIDNYPETADENEQLVGLNEWGAWYYDGVMGRLHNYTREDGPGKTPLTETDGACRESSGEELADTIANLDAITDYGFELIYQHGSTEDVVNALIRSGLSPGQAWAYHGVKILCHSRNGWSKECGYSDHSAVSEPLRKAESKLDGDT